jgi:hypothetical protein
MTQTERQTRPKTRRQTASLLRAICLSVRIGNRDRVESLQPVRLHLITSKKNRTMRISQNSSAAFKFVRRVIANTTQIANEPDKNSRKSSPVVQATA